MNEPLSSATLSTCGTYRYFLAREWGTGPSALFVMLNPSTADAHQDDATIRRCIRYAQAWGCGALLVVNLYAYRATDPRELWQAPDPVGPDNDLHISEAAAMARESGGPLVAAWGVNARPDRIAQVLELPHMRDLTTLGTTKNGQPRHPLYLRRGLTPQPWTAPERSAA